MRVFNPFISSTAWRVFLQAVFFVPIFSTFVWAADSLRVRQKQEAGLEELRSGLSGLEEEPASTLPLEVQDTYQAIREIFQRADQAGILSLEPSEVDDLIRRQAKFHGVSFADELRGVLELPETEWPSEQMFDPLVRDSEVLFIAGGNSGRALRLIAKEMGLKAISVAPVHDDGGNYGKWQEFLKGHFGRFVLSLGGDLANIRTVEASLVVRQIMADRVPEKPKSGWGTGDSIRSLLIREITNALRSYRRQFLAKPPDGVERTEVAFVQEMVATDNGLIRIMATLLSAQRILSEAFPDLLEAPVLSKASGQNILALSVEAHE
jgi:hypothetical protein